MNFCDLLPHLHKSKWRLIRVKTEEEELILYLEIMGFKYQKLDLFQFIVDSEIINLDVDVPVVIDNAEFINHDDFDLSEFHNAIQGKFVLFTKFDGALKFDLTTEFEPHLDAYNLIKPDESSKNFSLVEWKTITDLNLNIFEQLRLKEKGNIKFKEPCLSHSVLTRVHKILENNLNPLLSFPMPKGCLLCGATGVGKSVIAKKLCYAPNYYAIFVYATEFACKYVGESERKIRDTFDLARKMQPSILVFDEFETLSQIRGEDSINDRMLTCLLTELDGISERGNVFVIGCVRDIAKVDSALKRPGRFDLVMEL
eukprot:NODE_247_length_12991_cov_0.678328.p5 type:complete len:313 gc:universal NODE_247_length_12991_cov_0.678328:12255-11317(-)